MAAAGLAAAMLAAQSFVNTAGPLITPRWGAAAVRLADGTVLALGGMNGKTALASAEIFDPSVLSTPYSANGKGLVQAAGPQFASEVPGVPRYMHTPLPGVTQEATAARGWWRSRCGSNSRKSGFRPLWGERRAT